ncbi:MAG: hypothetical protein ACRDRL_08270 [Sciscionella sp.]
MHAMGRRASWLTGAAVVAAAGGSAFAFVSTASGSQTTVTSTISADSSQVSAVKSAFTAAITADRQAQAPATTTYGAKANAAVSAGGVAPAVASDVRQAQLQDGKASLAKYFTPAQAKHEALGLTNAVNAEADPKFRNLGSGVSKVVYDQVAVSGDTATLRAEVTAWAKFQQQQSNGAWTTDNPVAVMIYSVTMVRNASGQWQVSSMVGDFAPGEGP